MRKPNSHECAYFGRKLSNVCCKDIIEVSADYASICIGSDRDDEIYFPPVLKKGEEMLKERVTLSVEIDKGDGFWVEIDLEDVLRFAARNCRGIYDRVASEEVEIWKKED